MCVHIENHVSSVYSLDVFSKGIRDQEEEENMKNVFKFLAVSKPDISTGINRLFKSFKTISQHFGKLI